MAKPTTKPPGDGSNVVGALTRNTLHELLTDLKNLKDDLNSVNGKLRSALKEHLANTGLNKTALAHIRVVENMTDTQRQDYIRSHEAMWKICTQHRWKTKQPDFLDGDKKDSAK